MFPVEETEKHDVVLELNSPKSSDIFATDQTPTPTGLFKNCEEYGIFEDIEKHVNPFEEIFRHAVEEKTGKVSTAEFRSITTLCDAENGQIATTQLQLQEEDTLHTPQVFPQIIEANVSLAKNVAISRTQSANSDLKTPEVDLKLSCNTTTSTSSNEPTAPKKYRAIAEKPPAVAAAASTISGTAIPIQTVKPLFKVDTRLRPSSRTPTICTVTSPSSASLTPTSQLPIKERLKVILNNNKSQRAIVSTTAAEIISGSRHKQLTSIAPAASSTGTGKYDERCMERRRAAATRYRNKMRNEHKELRKRNAELQTENEKLRQRLAELEGQLARRETVMNANSVSAPLQIPPSSIHLVMNIPKLIVPISGAPLLQHPITYSVEKKGL